MTRRHLIMAVAVAIAAWLALFGDKTPSADDSVIAEPVTRASYALARASAGGGAAPAANTSADKAQREAIILPLQKREQLMLSASGSAPGYAGESDALFTSQSWTPPAPPPAPAAAAPPPSAPPFPFTYLGKKNEGGKWEFYLTHGERTLVAKENATLEGTYRVDSITSSVLSLTYLPSKQVQTLTLGGID